MLKFHSPFSLLHHCLNQLTSDAEIKMLHGKRAVCVSGHMTVMWGSCDLPLQVFGGSVSVIYDDSAETVSIEVSVMWLDCESHMMSYDCHTQWDADSVTDMYADAVLSVILQIVSDPNSLQGVFYVHCVEGVL